MGLAQGLLGVCSQGLELGFSHLEAPLELKDTFSRWLIHMATAPYDLDFSIGLSDCPHDMEANFPSRERAQEWAMPSRPSPESHMPSFVHHSSVRKRLARLTLRKGLLEIF